MKFGLDEKLYVSLIIQSRKASSISEGSECEMFI